MRLLDSLAKRKKEKNGRTLGSRQVSPGFSANEGAPDSFDAPDCTMKTIYQNGRGRGYVRKIGEKTSEELSAKSGCCRNLFHVAMEKSSRTRYRVAFVSRARREDRSLPSQQNEKWARGKKLQL